MELAELEFGLKYLSGSGYSLSVEETTGVSVGLARLHIAEKLTNVSVFGKIFGTVKDYYIAYGIQSSAVDYPAKKFFWATDAFTFAELPAVAAEDAARLANETSGPFSGEADRQVLDAGESGKALFELGRLAVTVRAIDKDTACVPKGAYVLNDHNQAVSSFFFNGLTFEAAKDIASYQHFRPPADVKRLRAMAKDDVQFASECLDPVAEDLPLGGWAVRADSAMNSVTLRSLLWPGYTSYHIPGSKFFGGMYIGHGDKNKDLPFIIP